MPVIFLQVVNNSTANDAILQLPAQDRLPTARMGRYVHDPHFERKADKHVQAKQTAQYY